MEEIEKLDLIENNENTEVLDISETNIQENPHQDLLLPYIIQSIQQMQMQTAE